MVRAERSPMIALEEPGVRTIFTSMASEPVESTIGAVTILAKLTLFAFATSFAISMTFSSVSVLMLSSWLQCSSHCPKRQRHHVNEVIFTLACGECRRPLVRRAAPWAREYWSWFDTRRYRARLTPAYSP